MPGDDLPVLAFESRQAWEDWLDEHHQSSPGLLLKIAKKGVGAGAISYAEAPAAKFAASLLPMSPVPMMATVLSEMVILVHLFVTWFPQEVDPSRPRCALWIRSRCAPPPFMF